MNTGKRRNRLLLKRLNQKSRAITNLENISAPGSSPVHPQNIAGRLAKVVQPYGERREGGFSRAMPTSPIALLAINLLLREARIVAAEEGRSLSALLTNRLEAIVRKSRMTES